MLFAVLKFTNIEIINDKVKTIQKKKCLHYSLLIIIFIIFSVMKSIPQGMKGDYTDKSEKITNPFTEGPFANMAVEMILLTIVSMFLLKYKYFIHHIIGIAAFIIFGAICDGVLNYYPEIINYGYKINIMQFLSILFDVVHYYYQKYMMEVLYYPYWRICFTLGTTLLCLATILLIFVLIDKDKAGSTIAIVSDFYLYFKEVHPGLIVGKQLIIMVIYFIQNSLATLNINYTI